MVNRKVSINHGIVMLADTTQFGKLGCVS